MAQPIGHKGAVVSCVSCGAPINAGSLICEFCGTAQKTITDPADEVRAIQELSTAWSKMGQKTANQAGGPLGQMFGQGHPVAMANKARSFWNSAYMPSTTEGLFAAAEQAAMLVADFRMGDMMAPTLNPIMLSRMDNCLEMLEIKAPGDPRLAGLMRLYEKKKKENSGIWKKMGLCFPADTRFLTPSGYCEIAELNRGDEVISVSADGQMVTQRVARKIAYGLSEVLCLEVGGRRLRTTAHHSLQTEDGWALAGTLGVGDRLQCVDDQGCVSWATVDAVHVMPAEPVFNLHTTGPHTAVVEGIVTHNFNKLRWLRGCWHRWVIDPWVGIGLPQPQLPTSS